jgi:hypothetical protein
MSHHPDSPASRQDPRLDLTDVYVFDGADATVLALAVNTSLAGAAAVAGFHPEGRYELKVHLDREERERLAYRVAFRDRDGAGAQAVTLTELAGADARDDAATGHVVAEGRTGETVAGSGLRLWAGPVADPAYLDLQLAHIVEGLQEGKSICGWTADAAAASVAGSQVWAIVLEVPLTDPRLRAGRRVGVWARTVLATDAGGWRQIDRTGIRMVWPLFRALGDSDDSSEYVRDTAGHPAQDRADDTARVTGMTSAAARGTGTPDPEAYGRTGRTVVERLLAGVLPYPVDPPPAFSFTGRSLADNAPEVLYGLLTNTGFPTGLAAPIAAANRQDGFPCVVPVPVDPA